MANMRKHGENGMIFYGMTVVLFLSTHVAVDVPAVTNVSLNCHNFNNVLYWNYSDSSLAPSFRVDIGTFYSSKLPPIDSSDLQADVSALNDRDEYYSLTVTAVIAGNQSDPSPTIRFSYYKGFGGQICSLDLPRVNVTVQSDHIVAVRFPHPSLSYSPMQGRRRTLLEFTYQLTLIGVYPGSRNTATVYGDGVCREQVCEERFPGEESADSHCVRIEGVLGGVAVLSTQDYCSPALAADAKYILLYTLCPLLVCVLGFVLWMVYRKLTRGILPLPTFMMFKNQLKPWGPRAHPPLTVERTAVSPVLSLSPGVTPLLPVVDREEFTHCDVQAEPEERRRIGASPPDRSTSSGLEERPGRGEGHGEGYEAGTVLDVGQGNEEVEELEELDCLSGYEKRVSVAVQMAAGDPVKGYQG